MYVAGNVCYFIVTYVTSYLNASILSSKSAEFYLSRITSERSSVSVRALRVCVPRNNIFRISGECYLLPLRNIAEMDPHSEVKQNPAFGGDTTHFYARNSISL